MVIPQRFVLYLVFHNFIILLQLLVLCRLVTMFVFHRLVITFYLCVGDLDDQNIFDQTDTTNQIVAISRTGS